MRVVQTTYDIKTLAEIKNTESIAGPDQTRHEKEMSICRWYEAELAFSD